MTIHKVISFTKESRDPNRSVAEVFDSVNLNC